MLEATVLSLWEKHYCYWLYLYIHPPMNDNTCTREGVIPGLNGQWFFTAPLAACKVTAESARSQQSILESSLTSSSFESWWTVRSFTVLYIATERHARGTDTVWVMDMLWKPYIPFWPFLFSCFLHYILPRMLGPLTCDHTPCIYLVEEPLRGSVYVLSCVATPPTIPPKVHLRMRSRSTKIRLSMFELVQ